MMRIQRLQHVFVEYIPEILEPTKLYISLEFATASHKCCCGCGREVVTPFSPNDWKMTFDGESISLSPSIGNRNFPCRSHYFIRSGHVVEAPSWDHGPETRPSEKTSEERPASRQQVGALSRFWRKLFAK